MTERYRSASYDNSARACPNMANGLSPRHTMVVFVIVFGCFAALIPHVFYPMLIGTANQHLKPSPIDKTTGCCDVISETDVNTIKIMSKLCSSIIKQDLDNPLTGREVIAKCRSAVLDTCGIDISAVLQEQVRLGQSFKQILDEVRSLNGSLCLKYNFGLAPWRLGIPHRVTVKVSPSFSIRQERPHHLRSEMVHPAFRERGRAIPPQHTTSSRHPTPRIVEGRPGPVPGMRRTMGGAGHIVPPPKHSSGLVGLLMPFYTVAIVIFFSYTVMKVLFKKQPENLYPPVEPDPNFRREVFESERNQTSPLTKDGVSSKLVVNAMTALLDEVDHELESRRKATEVAEQDVVANGNVINPQEEDQASVKVLGMEMTASCEGGKKWSRPDSPVLPTSLPVAHEPTDPPQEIFLEGALPAQSQLLVADSATEAQKPTSEEDPAVVLAGKMTLSVISLDSSENGTDESSNSGHRQEGRSSSNTSEDFEKIETDIYVEDPIIDIVNDTQNLSGLDENTFLAEIERQIKELDSEIVTTVDVHVDGQNIETLETEKDVVKEVITLSAEQVMPELSVEQNDDLVELGIGNMQGKTKEFVDHDTVDQNNLKKESTENNFVDGQIKQLDSKNVVTEEVHIDDQNMKIALETEENVIAKEVSGLVAQEELSKISVQQKSDNLPELANDIIQTETDELEPTKEAIFGEAIAETILRLEGEPVPSAKQTEQPVETVDDVLAKEVLQQTTDKTERPGSEKEVENPLHSPLELMIRRLEEKLFQEDTSDEVSDQVKSVSLEAVEKEEDDSKPTQQDDLSKLNEAIKDLASEFRPTNVEDEHCEDIVDEPEEGEEIEYEYGESDEEIDEEIRNVDRLNLGAVQGVNGDNNGQSKHGTTSSATMAENDISDVEHLANDSDDEEVEEIIEYVTDEEEVDGDSQPEQRNNLNHVIDESGADE